MKEWLVIHKVKALYNNGQGLSQREIAKELGLSRNTVRIDFSAPQRNSLELYSLG